MSEEKEKYERLIQAYENSQTDFALHVEKQLKVTEERLLLVQELLAA